MIKFNTKNLLAVMLMILTLAGCDNFGSRKVKNIVELSTRLQSNNLETVELHPQLKDISPVDITKFKAYRVARDTVVAEPLFAKAVIYTVDSQGNANAFSIKEKKLLWTSELNNQRSYNFDGGGMAVKDDKLYLTNGSRYLTVLNRNNGNELFRKEFPDIIKTKPVLLQDDIVIVQTVSNQVFAYNTENSNLVWQHEGPQEILSSTNRVAPVVVRDQVLISYSSGYILSLSKAGEERWAVNVNREQDIGLPSFEQSSLIGEPLISDEYAYLAVANGKIIKVNIDNGQVAWEKKIEDAQTISLNGANIMITTNARQLAIIGKNGGEVKWVGELEIAGKKKSKIVKFINPIVSEDNNKLWLNVAANNASMYSFEQTVSGRLTSAPLISKIKRNIKYGGMTCCNKLYFLTDKDILLRNEK